MNRYEFAVIVRPVGSKPGRFGESEGFTAKKTALSELEGRRACLEHAWSTGYIVDQIKLLKTKEV